MFSYKLYGVNCLILWGPKLCGGDFIYDLSEIFCSFFIYCSYIFLLEYFSFYHLFYWGFYGYNKTFLLNPLFLRSFPNCIVKYYLDSKLSYTHIYVYINMYTCFLRVYFIFIWKLFTFHNNIEFLKENRLYISSAEIL